MIALFAAALGELLPTSKVAQPWKLCFQLNVSSLLLESTVYTCFEVYSVSAMSVVGQSRQANVTAKLNFSASGSVLRPIVRCALFKCGKWLGGFERGLVHGQLKNCNVTSKGLWMEAPKLTELVPQISGEFDVPSLLDHPNPVSRLQITGAHQFIPFAQEGWSIKSPVTWISRNHVITGTVERLQIGN